MQRRTLTPPHMRVQPEGLPRIFRDRHRPDALAPRISGPGQTMPAKRASWADVNDKPDGGNKKKQKKKMRRKRKGCNTRTSQEVTHPSTTLAQTRLTAEF
ncbi:hypothetical protein ACB092_05G108900 [Castanea dentata]